MHSKQGTKTASGKNSILNKYACFYSIDGSHPLQQAVPDTCVKYAAKTRHGGRVFYFNFDLARHMGLIPADHPNKLNHDLKKAIIDAFSLEIINEYDLEYQVPVPAKDIRPNMYMATRYLQLQHPDKTGRSSGDGRSIWNGVFEGPNGTWDLSSCGTGATRLSPATAIEKKFFRTGDRNVSYGCGRADITDGLYTTIMSEIFHFNNIPTERMLAIIAFDDGSAINVRTYNNLLRPAHFFSLVKQGDYDNLKRLVDYFYARQVSNGTWPEIRNTKDRYEYMMEWIAEQFAKATALFESDYIFCWMDWDGDNILTDSSILDYGSIRQFGLFHHEYRFDDVDRYSTTITEQKNKCKYIVQTFAQIVDFLVSGRKKRIECFKRHRSLKLFDHIFEKEKDRLIVYNMGFPDSVGKRLLDDRKSCRTINKFRTLCRYFEHIKARRGPHKVEDGISWDAVFCLRDILRELPGHFLQDESLLSEKDFLEIMRSKYASRRDMIIGINRARKIREFQKTYIILVEHAARLCNETFDAVLGEMIGRTALINRADRITGDAVVYAAEKLSRIRRQIKPDELHMLLEHLINDQILRPEYFQHKTQSDSRPVPQKTEKIIASIRNIMHECREGI